MMNEMDKYRKHVESVANRNIDALIDGSIRKMQRKRRNRKITASVVTFAVTFCMYTVLLNTVKPFQVFALENPILNKISKPFIINLFEEYKTEVYTDANVEIEIVTNSNQDFSIEPIEEDKELARNHEKLPVIDGSDNDRYLLEIDPDTETMDFKYALSILKKTATGHEVVYTYNNPSMNRDILVTNDTVYVIDAADDAEYISDESGYRFTDDYAIYAIKGGVKTEVIRLHERSFHHSAIYLDGSVPHFTIADIVKKADSTGTDEAVHKIISYNLETGQIVMESDPIFSTGYTAGLVIADSKHMLLNVFHFNESPECGMIGLDLMYVNNGTVKNYQSCRGYYYNFATPNIILGHKYGYEDENEYEANTEPYYIINTSNDTTYKGSDVSVIYNMLENDASDILVLRIRSMDGYLDTHFSSNTGYWGGVRIFTQPRDVIIVTQYSSFEIRVEDNERNILSNVRITK